MFESYQFKLPFLQASQAQKHVTVNEALARLDALAQLTFQSRSEDVPTTPSDGQVYAVPIGASGVWSGQDHKVALFLNGGWVFVDGHDGWTAWVVDEVAQARFINGVWSDVNSLEASALGSAQTVDIQFDHQITAGATNETVVVIPHHSSVVGVTARVIEEIVFAEATDFNLGVVGADNRYGSGYGHWLNTYIQGLTGQPQTYYSDTPLLLTANGGDFVSGAIRFAIHTTVLTPPDAV
ncbi:DUF2793 domain-containing protein [Amylibacter sp. SFDW26]|uniref:DUF2793 domain-containing protein n=1 Tax=Amylibacter sp. SFDW26 TaxID=2652722 RepID=UPI001261FE6A|nr:DUF2793 domain-containing protein [Amylibacter sp. SFDW26]KAB7616070.1 DUF2793 domain-containing protein [Amylibacter sp. SFDW26]